ncbi:DUF349 domain-containing protein [Flagellimonas lutaonensis]|uniref:Chromosome segregation protein n=1 Tax=Flagellimonas lutaonensis TaxID=516051 RepID=A0A0D5YQ25_9FLAO|nr:DUF349 domain-containing protein [Allomuricauda lutaonensis]AKA33973.1 hypothetical protein VC82_287 [Allomuricauda lutaonensis]
MEEKDHKLQDVAGEQEHNDNDSTTAQPESHGEAATEKTVESTTEDTGAAAEEKEAPEPANAAEKADATSEDPENKDVLEEIAEENAEDAEDTENEKRHHIPFLDYHSMPMENLVGELQRLVKNEKVQAIHKHVSAIKYEFDQKYQEFIEHKKEEFVANGGNEIDFRYNSVTKRQFNEVYAEYREKRDHYYKNLEKTLKENLEKRLAIIEELKGLVNVEEDMNTTYKAFKELQARWRNVGPIPRSHYNDVWRTYHHHTEIFYDFLHLNRELRDLDFKHNLEEKIKLVERAEALADEPDLGKAFRELQTLHKIWKEDIGPVAKEHREEIWERFSNATKALHQRRQDHHKELEKQYLKNLEKKNELIAAIKEVAEKVADNHKAIQRQIRKVEELREAFFKAGRVPQKVSDATWDAFKEAVRSFNRQKNQFYKGLKKEQHENLEKKKKLLELALSMKDSDDFDTVTPEMKRIQAEWKKIGHVPRKYSDKIWNEFKAACNHYFDRLHSRRNASHKEELENYEKKNACLERLKAFTIGKDKEKDLQTVKAFIEEWKGYGRIPYNKKHINSKFNKIIDALLKKLGVSQQEAELIKYGNKIQQLAKAENDRAIANERTFIRRKIDEAKSEIRQLENNLQFFSNASEDNPLVQEVVNNIERHKETLATWKAKLKKLNVMENKLNKEAEDDEDTADSSEEE